jgi:aryl-alcohol dehydrogenase-like predicted oxidoreductase
MVDEGKVKAIGLCELQAHELRAAHAIHPISVIEQEYSLFARDMEVCCIPLSACFIPLPDVLKHNA